MGAPSASSSSRQAPTSVVTSGSPAAKPSSTTKGSPSDTLDSYIAALFDSQLIPKANPPLDQIFINRFVPEFNKIDAAAAAQKARQAEAAIRR